MPSKNELNLKIPVQLSIKDVFVVIGIVLSGLSAWNSFLTKVNDIEENVKVNVVRDDHQDQRLIVIERRVETVNDELMKHIYSTTHSGARSK